MIIKNYKELATSKERRYTLKIIEAGLEASLTKNVFKQVSLKGDVFSIKRKKYDLTQFKGVYVVGFGKASSDMAYELEKILGKRIKEGVVVDTKVRKLKRIKCMKGTHPLPSAVNVNASKKIVSIVKKAGKYDLIICLISGGGSALLFNPIYSVEKTIKIYDKLIKSGASIDKINRERKRISKVKGGKLGKLAYPAKMCSIIFSDVVGDDISTIASGPTAVKNVDNILLLTNKVAVDAMVQKAKELGLKVKVLSRRVKGEARAVGKRFVKLVRKNTAVLAAGETTVTVKGKGKGGRNQELCLGSLKYLNKGVIVSVDTDGVDFFEGAGAIVDLKTRVIGGRMGLSIKEYLDDNNSLGYFKKTKNVIYTGKTGTNIADIMIILG